MNFRLFYRGPIPSGSDVSPRHKHRIRKALHPQLAELWSQNAKWWGDPEEMGYICNRNGFNFVPVVRKEHLLDCSIEILFLRRDHPGNLVKSGGDIDNRIKTLFDGFRVPHSIGELGGYSPETDEDPFFVLLEDDSLITELSVTTDRLLTPPAESERESDVVLIIQLKVNYEVPTLEHVLWVEKRAVQSFGLAMEAAIKAENEPKPTNEKEEHAI
jgi:hypothetical protein